MNAINSKSGTIVPGSVLTAFIWYSADPNIFGLNLTFFIVSLRDPQRKGKWSAMG